ncbi:MAG TPA: aldehyde dehydrogenase family protein [Pirellulales bacterium]|jgi:glyceraldehyde-3-phosphate dehydrogenase (NADP+)|nr:aldehyde dehydrogenase family protein [Pirellulales bacterium]
MKMFVAGHWIDKPEKLEVHNPFDDSVVDTVPKADHTDVDKALASAVEGACIMRAMPGYERFQMLHEAAQLMKKQSAELARTITLEEGKPILESKGEVARAIETMELSSEEAKRIGGEVLPIDGASNGAGKLAFTLRVPCGVVVAITPFNFPLNLPCHKVGPALAAGNAVILKPASDTPLVALKLVEILLEAGLPSQAISCLTGSGGTLGEALCTDSRVRKISFTGSRDMGEKIIKLAGLKRVTMELGANCPMIVLEDSDLEAVAEAIAVTGYSNAGQTCISTQRVLALPTVYDDLLDALKPKVEALKPGNPLEETTKIGPMIRRRDAVRVNQWLDEAVRGGARLVIGGKHHGSFHDATIVADVKPSMRVSCEELFGPAVAVTSCKDIDEAIRIANDTNYGLSAAIFTRDLNRALQFCREVDSGNLHVNWGPQWRADLMPYGGLKESGIGKEGPRYAVEEMTEVKTVVIHGL